MGKRGLGYENKVKNCGVWRLEVEEEVAVIAFEFVDVDRELKMKTMKDRRRREKEEHQTRDHHLHGCYCSWEPSFHWILKQDLERFSLIGS